MSWYWSRPLSSLCLKSLNWPRSGSWNSNLNVAQVVFSYILKTLPLGKSTHIQRSIFRGILLLTRWFLSLCVITENFWFWNIIWDLFLWHRGFKHCNLKTWVGACRLWKFCNLNNTVELDKSVPSKGLWSCLLFKIVLSFESACIIFVIWVFSR